ncbi:rRNA large subunit pseudouridine synthase E [Ignavibacteria bacterium]|nr:pseudouridine synthase [Bacteroidota bacterium]MCZ2131848.1 pseudouridine synthase [Bacteroidota bacterium]
MLLAFNKPYGVLSQFTPDGRHRSLSEFSFPENIYPLGRLDADSEGLLLLSDEADLNNLLLNPKYAHWRTYIVQVERLPSPEALITLSQGVIIEGRTTLPCRIRQIDTPDIPERVPPVRFRKNVPTAWLELALREGKNRQVRRMTAAVGHPTLRLIRTAVGKYKLEKLEVGQWCELSFSERKRIFMHK